MNHLCSNSARAFAFLVMLFSAHLAFAGNQNVGTLSGRVSDQSGGSIAFATVTLLDGEHAIKGTQTSDVGTYQLSGLPPGYYRIRVTAKGFASTESSLFDLVTTRSKVLNLTLNVESVKEEIDVNSESPGTLNTEKDANANGITVTGKQLDALPDDPDDLQADLRALAGPGTVSDGPQFIVDGFTGARLPPKESIREVRINRDPFSAERDQLGYGRIEIFTNPDSTKLHGQAFFTVGDSTLNSRNPYASNKPGVQARRYGGFSWISRATHRRSPSLLLNDTVGRLSFPREDFQAPQSAPLEEVLLNSCWRAETLPPACIRPMRDSLRKIPGGSARTSVLELDCATKCRITSRTGWIWLHE